MCLKTKMACLGYISKMSIAIRIRIGIGKFSTSLVAGWHLPGVVLADA